MKSGAVVMKEVKDLGWDYITLTQKKGFQGAVKAFTNEGKTIALCFSMHEAFAVEDEQGLYSALDLYDGVVKDSYFNVEDSGDIDGAVAYAFEENGEVFFTDKFVESGIDTPEIREDIKKHLLGTASLDVMVDVDLG